MYYQLITKFYRAPFISHNLKINVSNSYNYRQLLNDTKEINAGRSVTVNLHKEDDGKM